MCRAVSARRCSTCSLDGCERSFVPMAARVTAHGPRRRTAIAATLALTAIVSAPLLETTLAGQSAAAPASSGEPIDYDAIYRIKDEAVNRSQVMETLSYLTDVHGPRLTNSPNMRAAAAWAKTAARELRARERRARGLGPVRPRLGQRAHGRDDDRAAGRSRCSPSRRRGRPAPTVPVKGDAVLAVDRQGRRLREVEGQAQRQDRAGVAARATCRPTSSRRRAAGTTRR